MHTISQSDRLMSEYSIISTEVTMSREIHCCLPTEACLFPHLEIPTHAKGALSVSLFLSCPSWFGIYTTDNVVQLPAGLGPSHGRVRVRALAAVLVASEVTVEPLTEHDWRLLQRHADWLEGGGFLSQMSVVYPAQLLVLSLPGGGTARVRVLNVARETTTGSLWPAVEEEEETVLPPCRRIVAETEIVLLPKEEEEHASSGRKECWLQPARQDYGAAMIDLHRQLSSPRPLVTCRPGTAVLSSVDGWDKDPLYARVSVVRRDENNNADDDFLSSHFVRVVLSDEVRKGQIGK